MINIKDYNAAFRKAYLLLEKYLDPKLKKDDAMIQADIAQFSEGFEMDLLRVVAKEIERISKEGRKAHANDRRGDPPQLPSGETTEGTG